MAFGITPTFVIPNTTGSSLVQLGPVQKLTAIIYCPSAPAHLKATNYLLHMLHTKKPFEPTMCTTPTVRLAPVIKKLKDTAGGTASMPAPSPVPLMHAIPTPYHHIPTLTCITTTGIHCICEGPHRLPPHGFGINSTTGMRLPPEIYLCTHYALHSNITLTSQCKPQAPPSPSHRCHRPAAANIDVLTASCPLAMLSPATAGINVLTNLLDYDSSYRTYFNAVDFLASVNFTTTSWIFYKHRHLSFPGR